MFYRIEQRYVNSDDGKYYVAIVEAADEENALKRVVTFLNVERKNAFDAADFDVEELSYINGVIMVEELDRS
jgi:hypothetical protein